MPDIDIVPGPLQEFFRENPRPALAFSGGADSSYLLYAAVSCGADVTPYFVKTQFQPLSEVETAERIAAGLGNELHVILVNVLSDPRIKANPEDRCYLCKKKIFGAITEQARADKKKLVIDATNASDSPDGRPGMRALSEMNVLSPLRICGMTKPEIRECSKKAGLETWDLPSNSCLATRIPFGTELTEKDLLRTEEAEEAVRALGFRDIRIRTDGETGRLEVTPTEMPLLEANRDATEDILRSYYRNSAYGERRPGL